MTPFVQIIDSLELDSAVRVYGDGRDEHRANIESIIAVLMEHQVEIEAWFTPSNRRVAPPMPTIIRRM
jgi:hypothetical protein